MNANWNVVLCLILFSTSYITGREFPRKHVKPISEFHYRPFSDLLLSPRERTKRHTYTETTEEYDYDYDYPIWPTTWVNQRKTSQRNCRCPPPRRTGYGDYGTGGYGSGGYGAGPYGSRGGSNYGNNRDRGYPTRRTLNRWFDYRDDYADEILVYRFYSGEGGRRRGYQAQQGNSGGGFQEERPIGGNKNRGRGSTLEFQGGRPVGRNSRIESDIGYSETETEYGSGRTKTDFESRDSSGSKESVSVEQGVYQITLNQNATKPKGKVRFFRFFSGIWEVENGDDYVESSTPTVIKIKSVGTARKTTRNVFSTRSNPTAAEYSQNNCCYQGGFEGGRRVGDTGRGFGRNPYRYTTKRPNFFGITWSKMLDYSDISDEVDADGRIVNLDVDSKTVASSGEDHAAVVQEEEAVTEINLESNQDGELTVIEEESERVVTDVPTYR